MAGQVAAGAFRDVDEQESSLLGERLQKQAHDVALEVPRQQQVIQLVSGEGRPPHRRRPRTFDALSEHSEMQLAKGAPSEVKLPQQVVQAKVTVIERQEIKRLTRCFRGRQDLEFGGELGA